MKRIPTPSQTLPNLFLSKRNPCDCSKNWSEVVSRTRAQWLSQHHGTAGRDGFYWTLSPPSLLPPLSDSELCFHLSRPGFAALRHIRVFVSRPTEQRTPHLIAPCARTALFSPPR